MSEFWDHVDSHLQIIRGIKPDPRSKPHLGWEVTGDKKPGASSKSGKRDWWAILYVNFIAEGLCGPFRSSKVAEINARMMLKVYQSTGSVKTSPVMQL